MAEEEGIGNFNLTFDGEEYYANTIKDLKKFIQKSRNPNTDRKTMSSVRGFEDFLEKEGFPGKKPTDFNPSQLNALIGNWLVTARKEDGENYEPDSLTALHRGLDRHLVESNYGHSILVSPLLETSRKVLASKRKNLKEKGLGNKKNRAEPVSIDDENEMWQSGALGEKDGETLQNTMWFLLSKHLGFRGCHEARQLCVGDLEKKKGQNGEVFNEWTEKISKTRQGNSGCRPFNPKLFANLTEPTKCPVRLLDKFLSHRPELMKTPESPFFLQINRNKSAKENVWYKCQPLGINSLGSFMKKIVKNANIEGERKLTNHSIRKTCCSRLLDAGVPPNAVAQLSGHKNPNSLNSYHVLNVHQHQAMSTVLAGNESNITPCLPGSKPLCRPIENGRASSTVTKPNSPNAEKIMSSEKEPVVFHIHNTGAGSVQIVYGNNPNISRVANKEHESIENTQIITPAGSKRKRILPITYDSDSDSN